MVTVASHASVAVGATNTGTEGQLIGVVCIAHVIVGGMLSMITTVLLQVAVFPQSSVAVHKTDVVPTGKKPLGGALFVNATNGSQLSVANGVGSGTT